MFVLNKKFWYFLLCLLLTFIFVCGIILDIKEVDSLSA